MVNIAGLVMLLVTLVTLQCVAEIHIPEKGGADGRVVKVLDSSPAIH